MNRAKWAAVLIDYINNSKTEWSWFTLTAHQNAHRTSDKGRYTLLNLQRAQDALMKRMRRNYGNFEYCRVYEKHKSGAYHLHAIRSGQFDDIVTRNRGKKDKGGVSREYNDSAWLRSTAKELGLGYMTHADNVPRGKAGVVAWYAVKYMTKFESTDFKGVRRIQTSRGIKYNQPSEYDWTIKSGLYLHDLKLGEQNYFLLNEGRELNLDDFDASHVWPPDEKKV